MDFLTQFLDPDTLLKLGAGYAALQGIANFLTMVLPKNTLVFKFAKQIIAGSSRAP